MSRRATDWGVNIAAFVAVLVMNGLANAVPLGGQNTGEISAKYPTLFTPAGYAFSIWGLIYLALACFIVYQALPAQRDDASLARISGPFKLNCVANASWILAWHYDQLWLSLALMAVILGSLIVIYRRLAGDSPDMAGVRRWVVRLPFSLYTAWIVVASLANATIVQFAMGWSDVGLTAIEWTWLKLALAGAIAAAMVIRGRDVVFALVVVWAALAIGVKQAGHPEVAGAAMTVAGLLAMLAALEVARQLRGTGSARA